MLDKLTIDDFAPLLDQTFSISLADDIQISAQLIEVKALGERPDGFRQAFSLLFCFMIDDPLPQQIYRLSHDSLGNLDIFFVPIKRGQTGVIYEALFT